MNRHRGIAVCFESFLLTFSKFNSRRISARDKFRGLIVYYFFDDRDFHTVTIA